MKRVFVSAFGLKQVITFSVLLNIMSMHLIYFADGTAFDTSLAQFCTLQSVRQLCYVEIKKCFY